MARKKAGKAKRKAKRVQRKVGKVLGEFKRGTLRSSSGRKVTSEKQAIAIGFSEAGASRKKKKGKKRKTRRRR